MTFIKDEQEKNKNKKGIPKVIFPRISSFR